MSNLAGFLKPLYTEATQEVVISDRFVDDEGNPLPFKLRSLTQERIRDLTRRSNRERVVNGKKTTELDADLFIARCLVESCIQPDFKDVEICHTYGTEDPLEVPQKMLLVGEYNKLGQVFMELNGISSGDFDLGEVSKN
jgi:hypothetical protein